MGRTPLSYKLTLLIGGLLAGWGLARLMPLLAEAWPPLQAIRLSLHAVVPIWAWGLSLLMAGILVALWAASWASRSSSYTSQASLNSPTNNPQPPPLNTASPKPSPSSTPAQSALDDGEAQLTTPFQSRTNGSYANHVAHGATDNQAAIYTNGATGHPNTGHPNAGHPNAGHPNTGHPNAGHPNTGHPNTGRPNIGPEADAKDQEQSFDEHGHLSAAAPNTFSAARHSYHSYKGEFENRDTHGNKSKGPKIVAIGGGTGMPQLLRGLRAYTDNITAIVTVADDGGSSGRLRLMGVLPPGDFRNNIAALSESEDLITRLFQYRFSQSQFNTSKAGKLDGNDGDDKTGLAGHNFGNLFIATMAAVTGSFEDGLAASSRVLAVRGRVLPSTLEHITLCAEVSRPATKMTDTSSTGQPEEEWLLVKGESKIPEAGGTIKRVFLEPQAPHAFPEAIRAILQADLILAGPGSFFTSILPNLLVPAVRDAIIASGAPSIYLCNIATQPGETDNYTVSDHMRQLQLHARDAFTNVLANKVYDLYETPASTSQTPDHPIPDYQWVTLPREDRESGTISDTVGGYPIEYRLFAADLVDERSPSRHDANKLAQETMNVYQLLQAEAYERN